MAIELNEKQRQGLEIAVSMYKARKPYTCIAGYAGTGKSTLVTFIIDALGIDRKKVAYVAYTGKAAMVLKQKGCPNAMTTHKLLYNTKQRRDGSFYHIPKFNLSGDYSLIVVDEISMLPKKMWDLLLSHNIYVLALGDPGQLPPIGDEETNNHVLDNPHIFLDEIMRQATESEIIKCSMKIREHNPLQLYDGKEVKIINKSNVSLSMCKWADQIICSLNATRQNLNHELRKEIMGAEDNIPLDGDKIICLRNNWDIVNGRGDCLINGMTGSIYNIRIEPVSVPRNAYNGFCIIADFLPDFYDDIYDMSQPDPFFRDVLMDYEIFVNGKPTLDKNNFSKIAKLYKPNEFDYGYAITCWKSQGSEYDKVLLYEEWFPKDEDGHYRYLYTGTTRSKKKLIVVMK